MWPIQTKVGTSALTKCISKRRHVSRTKNFIFAMPFETSLPTSNCMMLFLLVSITGTVLVVEKYALYCSILPLLTWAALVSNILPLGFSGAARRGKYMNTAWIVEKWSMWPINTEKCCDVPPHFYILSSRLGLGRLQMSCIQMTTSSEVFESSALESGVWSFDDTSVINGLICWFLLKA